MEVTSRRNCSICLEATRRRRAPTSSSLGVTLYEAASGLRFPRGATPRASLPPLPEGRSAELARLVDGCLATDPDQRATAQDVATFAQETVALLEQNAAR